MRAIMDEVDFRKLTLGTEIKMVKHRVQKEMHPLSMKFTTREVSGVTVLSLSGKITLGEGGMTLREEVRNVVAKGSKKILLNLGDVNYIDSSGLGELVSAFTAVKNAGGELKLVNLTKKVSDLLVITKLVTVFDVKDDEAAGIASFA